MARLRRAAIVSVALLGSIIVPVAANATGATTLFVNNENPSCSDAGTGTQAQPYCTIQAAANAVTAGQTVDLVGQFTENVVLTHSGTPTAPIVFTGVVDQDGVLNPQDANQPTITFSGVHDVEVARLNIAATVALNVHVIEVTGSSQVTLHNLAVNAAFTQTGVHIGGTSAHVSVIDNQITAMSSGTAVAVDSGSGNDVIAGNMLDATTGLTVVAAPGTAITNNTAIDACNQAISVTGASAGTTIENNAIGKVVGSDVNSSCAPSPTVSSFLVDAAAVASGVTTDYNLEYLQSASRSTYVWAGTAYPDDTSFTAATGQAAHDILGSGQFFGFPVEGSPAIDSGNDAAPGVPALDPAGYPRVDDPNDPDTGAGPIAYVDRGAWEFEDTPTASQQETASATQAPVGGVVTFTGDFADTWNYPFTCAFDFGDGTLASGPCNTTHAYSAVGTYAWHGTASNAGGLVTPFDGTITVVSGGTFTASVAVAASGAKGVVATVSAGTDPWSIASVTYTFGDGATLTTPATSVTHQYATPGRYKVTAKITDAGGVKKTISKNFTTAGTNFVAVAPHRAADTTIAAHGTVTIAVAGTGGVPTGVAAVAVNITAVNPAAGGTATAWAATKSRPATSNLNFIAGRTQADESFVAVGTNGSIKLLNGSGGANEFTVDVVGYFTTAAGDGYQEVDAANVVNTTSGGGQVQPGSPLAVTVGGVGGVPSSGVDAVMLNVTALDSAAAGALTVYPAGGTAPSQANIRYAAGQTVGNLVVVPVSAAGQIDVAASSAADVIVDVAGYFSTTSAEAYVPVSPVRDVSAVSAAPLAYAEIDTYSGVANKSTRNGTVMIDVTITGATGTGQMFVGVPECCQLPSVFQVHWVKSQQSANNIAARVMQGIDAVAVEDFYNAGSKPVNVTVDTYGYFAYA